MKLKIFENQRARIAGVIAVLLMVAAPGAADQLKGTLSADREAVRLGDEVTLLLELSGSGEAHFYEVEQPDLAALDRFSLVAVSQRNETDLGAAGEEFSIRFLYRIKAVKAGTESIPYIGVRYRKEGESEYRVLKVNGLDIVVGAAGMGFGERLFLLLIAVVVVLLLVVIYRTRRKAGRREKQVEPKAAGFEKSDAAVKALARVEEKDRLRINGDMGGYCTGLLEAVEEYLAEDPESQRSLMAGRLRDLCERLKYAREGEAEREVIEIGRKTELFLKEKIREGLE
jgi:hypothetical protein